MNAKQYIFKNNILIPFEYISDEILDCYYENFGKYFGISYSLYNNIIKLISDRGVEKFEKDMNELSEYFLKFNESIDKSSYLAVEDKIKIKNYFDKDDVGKIYMVFFFPHSLFYELYEYNILEKIKLEYIWLDDKEVIKFLSKNFFEKIKDKKIELFITMFDYFETLVKKFGINPNDIYFNENFEIMYFRVSLQNINAFKKAIQEKIKSMYNVKFDVFKLVSNNLLFNAKNEFFLTYKNGENDKINVEYIKELLNLDKSLCLK